MNRQGDGTETKAAQTAPELEQSHTYLRKISQALLDQDSRSVDSDHGFRTAQLIGNPSIIFSPRNLPPVPSSVLKQKKPDNDRLCARTGRQSGRSSDSIYTPFDLSQQAPMPLYDQHPSSSSVNYGGSRALDNSPNGGAEHSVSSLDQLITHSPLQADYFLNKYYQKRVSELEGQLILSESSALLMFILLT